MIRVFLLKSFVVYASFEVKIQGMDSICLWPPSSFKFFDTVIYVFHLNPSTNLFMAPLYSVLASSIYYCRTFIKSTTNPQTYRISNCLLPCNFKWHSLLFFIVPPYCHMVRSGANRVEGVTIIMFLFKGLVIKGVVVVYLLWQTPGTSIGTNMSTKSDFPSHKDLHIFFAEGLVYMPSLKN